MNRHGTSADPEPFGFPSLGSGDADPITAEVMAWTPRRRGGWTITRVVHRGVESVQLSDPLRPDSVVRLGLSEFAFWRRMDGRTTIATAMADIASRSAAVESDGDDRDGPSTVELVRQLMDADLIRVGDSSRGRAGSRRRVRAGRRSLRHSVGPLSIRTPIGRMPRVVAAVDRIWKLAPRVGTLSALVLTVGAAVIAIGRFDDLVRTTDLLTPDRLTWYAAFAVLLKAVHELGHVWACRRVGAKVGPVGVSWIVFVPLPHVDVSDTWRLTSKWKRMAVAAAGVAAEAVVAAAALWVWHLTRDPVIRLRCIDLIVTATTTSLLFNLNPLMKFDGYYLLSDWWEIPNLAENGRRWWSAAVRRLGCGVPVEAPDWPEGCRVRVIAYGAAAWLWRCVVFVTLVLAASKALHGAGVLLAAIAVVIAAVRPIHNLWKDGTMQRMTRPRLATVLAGAGLVLGLGFVPIRRTVTVPAVIHAADRCDVVAKHSQKISDLPAGEGQTVRPGDIIAVLDDPKLRWRRDATAADLAIAELDWRRAVDQRSANDARIARAHVRELTGDLNDLDARIAELTLRCTGPGVVVRRLPAERVGTWTRPGEVVAVVGSADRREVIAFVSVADADAVVGGGTTGRVWIDGEGSVTEVPVERIDPAVTDVLTEDALAADRGGPLAIYPRDAGGHARLVTPRHRLAAEVSGISHITDGHTALLRFASTRRSWLGDLLPAGVRW